MAKARILRTGETDITSTDIWRYVLHENYPTQKIAIQGSQTVSLPSGSEFPAIITISHDLGYQPICRVAGTLPSTRVIRVSGGITFSDEDMDEFALGYMSYGTDSEDLIISVGYDYPIPTTANRSFTFYYIILEDNI